MKFYAIYEGLTENIRARIDLFQSACRKKNIEFCAIDSLTFNYSSLPVLTQDDLLYNIGRGSEVLESLLINDRVTSFYIKPPSFIVGQTDTTKYSILHEKAKIPSPKTIFQITSDRQLLKNYVDYLGGFPIIIKATGNTMGIGTIKVETWENLISTADYLVSTQGKFILRQYIPNNGAARIVVLGNKVIASDFRDNLDNDFRVSGGNVKNYYQKNFDKRSNQIAIDATRIANLEVSGVDIIYDSQDSPFLLEVNTPFNFVPTQEVNNVDIALLMVEHLMNKSMIAKDMF